jgi:ketosteroid isomerase-like protein
MTSSDSVADRLAVSAVLDDYARGIDSKDWELVASVFTDDATLDYSAFGGPKGGRDDVVAWLQVAVSAFAMTQHHITNRHITLEGDEASSAAELFAPMGLPSGDGKLSMLLSGGCYNDRLKRTPDGWKISSRVCDRAWLASGPEATGPTPPAS